MTLFHLAQLNIAHAKYDMDSEGMADFVAKLDEINQLAEGSPGFVWRLQDEDGDATSINAFDDPRMLVNMSVWRDQQSLFDYVYQSAHTNIMTRRKQWFEHIRDAYHVLWWIDAATIPTIEEAKLRLDSLRSNGPSAFAFNFKNPYPQPLAA